MNALFNNLQNFNILIIGDVILDVYVSGSVNRISAEAPIPILDIKSKEYRLGGAANVALNIKAMGATPYLCSMIGNDESAVYFRNTLKKAGITDELILENKSSKTTAKTRFLSQFQQLLRVDDEITKPIDIKETNSLIGHIEKLLIAKKIDAIIFQDYDKGIITEDLIEYVTTRAKKLNIPITVDPKFRNFNYYKGSTLFKPNFKEFCNGTNTMIDLSCMETFKEHVENFRKDLDIEIIMVTLSERGLFIKDKNKDYLVPTNVKSVYDVSGAGDTVISIATLALAAKLNIKQIATLSNLAGGLVCEELGVVPINKEKFEERIKSTVLF